MLIGFVAAVLATIIYQNDFTTRKSDIGAGPGLSWSEFRYARGQPLSYNYTYRKSGSAYYVWKYDDEVKAWVRYELDFRTVGYAWQPSQDGWIKIANGDPPKDCMWTHVSDEDDPCLVFSATNAAHSGVVSHTFRNVFSNGIVRMQFDIRDYVKRSAGGYGVCWFRPVYESGSDPLVRNGTAFPIEIGMDGDSLSGGWNVAGSNDGYRAYHQYGTVKNGHWYRHSLTLNLDTNLADFKVWDLGTARIPIDSMPSEDPVCAKTGCPFRCRNTGGDIEMDGRGFLNGFSIYTRQINTSASFGDEGFDSDCSYMVDNIRGMWKPDSGNQFVEFYRNDFTKSMRRTVDGSVEQTSHTYTYDPPAVVTTTYTMYSNLVRQVGSIGRFDAPYLNGLFGNAVSEVKEPGADGWRFAGNPSFSCPVFVVPTCDTNNMISCASYGKSLQPMCEEVTSGKVRFEFDQRMPKGWNGTSRCEVDLVSQAAWERSTSLNWDGLVMVGCGGATDTGTQESPDYTARAYLQGSKYDYGLKNLTWYRFRSDIDLDARTVCFHVYEIGDSAPADPDDFTPGRDNEKFEIGKSSATILSLYSPSEAYRNGIAAWGISNWNRAIDSTSGNDAQDFQSLIDNVRFWKLNDDGSIGSMLFSNNGSQTRRTYTKVRKALSSKMRVDRPEYCEDGMAIAPTYIMPNYITGTNHALQVSGNSYLAMSVPLGSTVRSGILIVQYDVRMPNNVDYDKPFMMYIGGAQLGSASELGSAFPQRFNTGYAFGTGIWNRYVQSPTTGRFSGIGANGVRSVMSCAYTEGDRCGKEVTRMSVINSDGRNADRWVRIRIVAHVGMRRYDVSFYDMGSSHPSFDTNDGDLLIARTNVPFRWVTDPISYMYILGGHAHSYAPWMDEAPGACLVDNISVVRIVRGMMVIVK